MTHLCTRRRPDGFNGHTQVVSLEFDGKHIIESHEKGKHKSPVLPMGFLDADEAIWHINNHPAAKRFYSKAR